jgi:tetratricopeptide (TPR) repeat protein
MAGSFAALPFLCQKLSAKQATYVLVFVALFMMPLSWLRLKTFSHPLLLWDDAARLVEHSEVYYPGMERIFYNRGNAYKHLKKYTEALNDYNKTIQLAGTSGYLTPYAYNNRGALYFETQQYSLALTDFTKAIEFDPKQKTAYLGKARALEALNQLTAATDAYQQACRIGVTTACKN